MTSKEANPQCGFSDMDRFVIAALLKECIDAWRVYQNKLNLCLMNNAQSVDFGIPQVLLRYSSEDLLSPATKIELQKLQEQADLDKIRADSLYTVNFLERLRMQIQEKGRFDELSDEIENLQNKEKEEKSRIERSEQAVKEVTTLRKLLGETKIKHAKEEKRLKDYLVALKEEEEKVKLIGNVEERYVRAWEKARREQNSLQQQIDIKRLEDQIKDCSLRENSKTRVHREKMLFFKQHIMSIESEIEEWRERHRVEGANYEKEIRAIQNEIGIRREELEELTREYRERQEFIEMYEAEKEAARKQKEYEAHVQRTVIRIQAWWRGVMVRRKLGPYRVEEKKKKKPTKGRK
ncbi:dynein regulatory complex protein 9-like [Prorops nasuta]|uniref:dynein regulatory complex protein 9-like n=1 Tax=Prorops nasuta TaxID=863751 RepID=UPI0034CF62E1